MFDFFYKIVKMWKNSIFMQKNNDAEFEKEIFFHFGLDLKLTFIAT
jgi:hypothetical protein